MVRRHRLYTTRAAAAQTVGVVLQTVSIRANKYKTLRRRAVWDIAADAPAYLVNVIVTDVAIAVEVHPVAVARIANRTTVVVARNNIQVSPIDAAVVVEIINTDRLANIGVGIVNECRLLSAATVG